MNASVLDDGSSLVNAVVWLRDLLTGTVGLTVAVLAMAAVGLLMLSGRLPVRRGVTVVIGCFVLFSAGTIADGLLAVMAGGGTASEPVIAAVAPAYTPTTPAATPYDPYAGASVPTRRSPSGDLLPN